ncbi:MAG: hypothetical protein K6T55_08975 [Syntrophobacterales bacterium]|nr:hypothetical protein [Syntrophobacterales bacterium]
MLAEAVLSLRERALPDGGFRSGVRGGYRSDATAWAVLALRQAGAAPELWQVSYLAWADGRLGPVREAAILQVGEPVAAVMTPFALLDHIPALRGLGLRRDQRGES